MYLYKYNKRGLKTMVLLKKESKGLWIDAKKTTLSKVNRKKNYNSSIPSSPI